MISRPVEMFWMESRESIISGRLGMPVNQILAYCPTDQKLKDMRDGLLRLNKRLWASGN